MLIALAPFCVCDGDNSEELEPEIWLALWAGDRIGCGVVVSWLC